MTENITTSQRVILSFSNVLVWTVENHRNSSVDANRPMRFRRQKRVPLKNAFVFPIPRRRVIRVIIDISPLKLTYANRSNADGLHNPIQSFAA